MQVRKPSTLTLTLRVPGGHRVASDPETLSIRNHMIHIFSHIKCVRSQLKNNNTTMFQQQVQRSLQHIQTTPSSAPYNIKEEQNNNERTSSSKPTIEQLHNEDNMSKYQNECQT